MGKRKKWSLSNACRTLKRYNATPTSSWKQHWVRRRSRFQSAMAPPARRWPALAELVLLLLAKLAKLASQFRIAIDSTQRLHLQRCQFLVPQDGTLINVGYYIGAFSL